MKSLGFPVFTSVMLTVWGCATAFGATPEPAYASYFDKLPCVDRIGRCFDASVGGQPVVVIEDRKRHGQLTREAKRKNSDARDIYWEVVAPVDGKVVFDVIVKTNALGAAEVGEPTAPPELTIYPLHAQEINSESALVASDTVRVSGHPVVTQQNLLTQDFLPPGHYVIAIRYRGKENWERKQVYLVVK